MAKVFITSHYINLKMLPALRLIVSNVEKSPLPFWSIHFSFFKVSFSHLIDHTDCDHGWINLIEEDDKYDFRIKKTYQLEPCCIRQGLYSSFDLTFSHHRENNSDDFPSYSRRWYLQYASGYCPAQMIGFLYDNSKECQRVHNVRVRQQELSIICSIKKYPEIPR